MSDAKIETMVMITGREYEALRAEVEKLRAGLEEIAAMDEVAIVEFKKGDGWLHQRVARAALEKSND